MKKILIIVGAVVLAVALSAGSFVGGMAYQRSQQSQIQANFFRSRGLNPNGENANGFSFNGSGANGTNPNGNEGQRGFFGGGVNGQVKSVDGNVLMVSTPQNVTTVNLTDSTRIEKATTGTTADLQTGEQVLVTGQRDDNGNVTAVQVLIMNNGDQSTGTAP
jgi:hypothetical protein